ncbi:DUF424 family protein [Candidatus Pacearchaeota archaeon]|nr:DUF424 family protein [Candidatus Pacearchaeota archaeon]
MLIKIHESYRKIAAVCDKEIVGKKFEEGKRQLDVKESFYKGEEIDEESLIWKLQDLARDDATFNIVGNKSVSAAMKSGVISKGDVGEIDGVKFALLLF